MSGIQGVICPNCGIKHNAPGLHRCKYYNPAGVKKAAETRQKTQEMYDLIRRQGWTCARCRYELPTKGNRLEQVTAAGVVCRSCFRKGDEDE